MYRTLQYFFYSFSKKVEDKLTHNNRYSYSILKNILSNNCDYINLLLKLQPEYSDKVSEYNKFISNIINRCFLRFNDSTYGHTTNYAKFINRIVDTLKKNEPDLKNNNEVITKLLNDYVKDANNTKELLDIYEIEQS